VEESHHRGLSTARAVLEVEWLLARTPDGVRADEVAAALGKSSSTAYNLLASLVDEGIAERRRGGVYGLDPGFRRVIAAAPEVHDLSQLVDDLLARTHKRAYLAVPDAGSLRVVAERGVQGMPRIAGMDPEIRDNAHALALGKVVLALAPDDAVERYMAAGLRPFTSRTITRPADLREELRAIRRTGVATDEEEFGDDLCCIAAPILDDRHRFLGAVGISMTRRAFHDEHQALEETLRDVARFQPSAENDDVLEPHSGPHLASAGESTMR
jgi:DNA-binding IclR family transcriptional regulator